MKITPLAGMMLNKAHLGRERAGDIWRRTNQANRQPYTTMIPNRSSPAAWTMTDAPCRTRGGSRSHRRSTPGWTPR